MAESLGCEHILVMADDVRHTDLTALCEPGPELDVPAPDPTSVAVFLLSGGTTGLPKLIARTHDDYAYNARRYQLTQRRNSSTGSVFSTFAICLNSITSSRRSPDSTLAYFDFVHPSLSANSRCVSSSCNRDARRIARSA
jgi:acyl-CoA synthetase (AMP-forming)/AMP-acid ligase II